jgi:hypothetical protein
MDITLAKVALLRKRHVGKMIRLGSGEYRISGLDRRVYDHTKLDVYLERLNEKGVVLGRTWTVLDVPAFYAKIVR